MGVVFGGLGFGVLVVVPAVQYAIQDSGWRTAYHLIGGALLLFAPVLLILPWRRIAAGHPDFAEERRRKAAHGGGRVLLRAIGTGAFWGQIGRAHVSTPVNHAHHACRHSHA